MARRVLYLQFTNPGGYPPLEHGARILADCGWQVTFLGSGAFGDATNLDMKSHARILTYRMPYVATPWLRKIAYIGYCAWAAMVALALRPRWIYASDPLGTLPALLASAVSRGSIIYHEHDSPADAGKRAVARSLVARCRVRAASVARLCILPNEERARWFHRDLAPSRPVLCVWNCPEKGEAILEAKNPHDEVVLFYHGSLNRERLPFSLLEAMSSVPGNVRLQFAGYATAGAPRYVQEFLAEAARLGVGERIRYLGAPSERPELLRLCRRATVGISLMPMESADANMRAMAGASNKPFDYMACGLALLVSALPDWRALFVEPGYALECDPRDAGTIARALAWFVEHREETARMGENGRRRIAEEWNYERCFAPVIAEIEQP